MMFLAGPQKDDNDDEDDDEDDEDVLAGWLVE